MDVKLLKGRVFHQEFNATIYFNIMLLQHAVKHTQRWYLWNWKVHKLPHLLVLESEVEP